MEKPELCALLEWPFLTYWLAPRPPLSSQELRTPCALLSYFPGSLNDAPLNASPARRTHA